jgi:hypothetical protein
MRLKVTTVAIAVLVAGATAGAASSEAVSPLVGKWQTSVISQSDVETTLRRHGLSKWIAPFRRETFLTEPMAMVLVIHREWDLYGKPKGKPLVELDYDAGWVAKGNTVRKIHSTGVTTFQWSVRGDTLTLRWLRTTEPPVKGIPDKVFQYAHYMTRKFSRAT